MNQSIKHITLSAVARAFHVQTKDVAEGSRSESHVSARQAAAWLLRHECRMSLQDIGDILGRHHTSVMYSVDAASAWTGDLLEMRTYAQNLLRLALSKEPLATLSELVDRVVALEERIARLETR